ncbi:uncharacterized protein LOC143530447 [Bidens hawaiensis]|uniref:uncharacterized protein LOC143530447 n=1 Tax=Bidens hawaiensis TaxID=980011 RepID=UPI004049DC2B
MARKAVIESLILNKACRISLNRTYVKTPVPNSRCRHRIINNIKYFCLGRRIDLSNNRVCDKNVENMQTISGHDILTYTNNKFGSTAIDGSTGEWLTLNEQINTYPSVRRFTAIGSGGDDFVRSMVVAVESVIQHPVPQGYVQQRVSSSGKYVSVNIGPVRVISREQHESK